VMCYQVLNMCSLRSAPLLERWCILEWAATILRGGASLDLQNLQVGISFGYGRGGSPSSHTWHYSTLQVVRPLHQVVHPPSWEPSPSCYIIKHSPICLVSWSSWKNRLCIHCYCTIILYWNKERLWRQTWCRSHVWIFIVVEIM
jgi:hypothetical protein